MDKVSFHIAAALNLSSFQQCLLPEQTNYLAALFNIKPTDFTLILLCLYINPLANPPQKNIYRVNINYYNPIRLSLPVDIS